MLGLMALLAGRQSLPADNELFGDFFQDLNFSNDFHQL
jgi:hypothetical protein